MPPRKRAAEPVASRPKRRAAGGDTSDKTTVPRKPTLFDALDTSPARKAPRDNLAALQSLDDSASSLSELSDADFEEPAPKKAKTTPARTSARTSTKATKTPAKPKPAKPAKPTKPTKAKEKAKEKAPMPKDGILPRKATLFDELDGPARSAKANLAYLAKLDGDADGDADGDSSDGGSDDDEDVEFEDVPLASRAPDDADDDDDAANDDDAPFSFLSMAVDHDTTDADARGLELTLVKDTRVALTQLHAADGKTGPSKMERLVRSATHGVHVQALLWHNAVRNAWLCDGIVQGLLLSHLPARVADEAERWQALSQESAAAPDPDGTVAPNDPLVRLLRVLSTWWRRAFRVTAPGLRKTGYMTLERLDRLLKAAKDARGIDTDAYRFGEQIRDRQAFRGNAERLDGSRDVGAQLFTALLRALGVEARMVGSLQPLGFGWSKLEDADAEVEDAHEPTPKRHTTADRHATADHATADDLEIAEVDSDNEIVGLDDDDDTPAQARFDADLPYPVYWTEAYSTASGAWVPVDALVRPAVATTRELVEATFEPRGARAERVRQVMGYVVAHASDGTAKDVTVRYLRRQTLPGRTRGVRVPPEKVPVHGRDGKVKRYTHVDWFRQAVMRGYARGFSARWPVTEQDEAEDAGPLRPRQPVVKPVKEGEETLQYYKQSTEFVLVRHLKREEALVAGAQPVKRFVQPKRRGSTDITGEDVFLRRDVVTVKSAETWHKQGRAPRPGEQPLKMVPFRAATTNRKREIAEAEAATGQKALQGLYAEAQTDWIIPPPIRDGVIPKNAYGNIDLFAAHMCPQGAVHVPFRGGPRVCRRLGIDFAEAVVGFEFGNRMAVPVIQGVVVAEEHHATLVQHLERDEAERARKEDAKRQARALKLWRRMLMGLRVVERVRAEYGAQPDVVDVVDGEPEPEGPEPEGPERDKVPDGFEYDDDQHENEHESGFFPIHDEHELESGFFPNDDEHELESGFFPVHDDDDDDDDEAGGGFIVE